MLWCLTRQALWHMVPQKWWRQLCLLNQASVAWKCYWQLQALQKTTASIPLVWLLPIMPSRYVNNSTLGTKATYHQVWEVPCKIWLSLHTSQIVHQAGTSFRFQQHGANKNISTPPLMGCCSIAGLPLCIKFTLTHSYTRVEQALWEQSAFFKNTTQCTMRPLSLDKKIEIETLTVYDCNVM